jgi:hypothetical protein
MTRKEQLAIINRAFAAMDGPQDGFSTVRDKLFAMNKESERKHRRFTVCASNLPVSAAAKLFTAQRIAQALLEPDRFTVDDVTYIRLECLYAQAYARRFRAELLAAWEAVGLTPEQVLAPDYAELMP